MIVQLKSKWCECTKNPIQEMQEKYFPDGICKCNTFKHHYHCNECGGITQIG